MLTRPSLALDFFSRIQQAGDRFGVLSALVNASPPTFECDWLDFKVGDDPAIKDKRRLEDEQKKVWSKALSAMANSGGGVLVWGIKAEKDKATGVDAANALALVPDVHQFITRLQELHRQATDPPILNVEYMPVPRSEADRSGFVACLIPDSPFKPHRAEYVEGKPFFVRAGDNSAPASVALLRALFYPATNSLINLDAGISWRVDDHQAHDLMGKESGVIHVHGVVQNVGTSTARDVFITLKEFPPGMKLKPADGWSSSTHLEGQALAYTRPFHPGVIVPAFTFDLPAKFHATHGGGISHLPDVQAIKLIFGVYAADREPQHGVIDFNEDDIIFQKNKNSVGDLGYRYPLPEHWHRLGIVPTKKPIRAGAL
jgi:hypothetical protein